jgi:hypothetical protein
MAITRNTLFGVEVVEETKVCDRCFIEKPIEDFEPNRKYFDPSNPNGRVLRRPSCRECRSSKKRMNQSQKKYYPKPKGEYFECPSCGRMRKTSLARLDHDHKTGNINGYICDPCNTAFGNFDEDPEIMKRAYKWKFNDSI